MWTELLGGCLTAKRKLGWLIAVAATVGVSSGCSESPTANDDLGSVATEDLNSVPVEDSNRVAVYAGSQDGIDAYVFSQDTTAVVPVPGARFAPGRRVMSLIASNDRVYSIETQTNGSDLVTYQIDRDSGTLRELDRFAAPGVHLDITPDGRVLYVKGNPETHSSWLSGLVIDPKTGIPRPGAEGPVALGYDSLPAKSFLAFHPSKRFVYVPNGARPPGEHEILAFRYGTAAGPLEAVPGSPFDRARLPHRHLAAVPSGHTLYSIGWDWKAFRVDLATGSLMLTAQSQRGFEVAHSVAVHPTARWLYVAQESDRGTGGAIMQFEIDTDSDDLRLLRMEYVRLTDAGFGSAGLMIDRSGKVAIVERPTLERSLISFTVDLTTGALSATSALYHIRDRAARNLAFSPGQRFLFYVTTDGPDCEIWLTSECDSPATLRALRVDAARGEIAPLDDAGVPIGSNPTSLAVAELSP